MSRPAKRPAAQPCARTPAPAPAATQNGFQPRCLLLTDFDKTLTDCDAGAPSFPAHLNTQQAF